MNKKTLSKIMYACAMVVAALGFIPAFGLMYALKFVGGLIMCLAYPFEFARLKITQKEEHWGKSMYVPSGLRFALAKIDLQ